MAGPEATAQPNAQRGHHSHRRQLVEQLQLGLLRTDGVELRSPTSIFKPVDNGEDQRKIAAWLVRGIRAI